MIVTENLPILFAALTIAGIWLVVILFAVAVVRTLKPGTVALPPDEAEDPETPEYWPDPGPRHPDHGGSHDR